MAKEAECSKRKTERWQKAKEIMVQHFLGNTRLIGDFVPIGIRRITLFVIRIQLGIVSPVKKALKISKPYH